MSDADPQLELLQMAERLALERFIRLSATNGMPDHPEIVQTAKRIWGEAAASVLAYKRK
jgi:hypothetical protein